MAGDESKSISGNVVKEMVSACTGRLPAPEERHYTEVFLNECVTRTAAGEQTALAALYDETNHLVYGLALRILGDTADAEEVTLEVYTQVWKSAKHFDPRRGNAAAWLVMLTRSRAIDHLRSNASRKEREEPLDWIFDLPASTECPEQASALGEQRRWVRAALEQLSPEQREAIELAFFSGLTHQELAARLDQPLGTVKTRIRLGMMKLRELLGAPGAVRGQVS